MDTPCLLIRVISGLISVENDSGLLFALAILNGPVTIAEYTILGGTLLDLSDILTIGKEMSLFYQRGQNETFHPFFFFFF